MDDTQDDDTVFTVDDTVFTVEEALAAGMTRDALRSKRFDAPTTGTRVLHADRTLEEARTLFVQSIERVCSPEQFFASVTAARLHELPLPGRLDDDIVHIASPHTRNRMRRRRKGDPFRVQGHRFKADVEELQGLRVESLEDTIIHLGFELTVDELVAVCDAAVSPRRARRSSVAAIAERARVFTGSHALPVLRSALPLARGGADSPGETRTRLLIVRAGMPEPVLQHEVRDAFGRVVRVDMAWPDLRIAIEYEGDHHRTDDGQWGYDIRRYRALEAAGWLVIRVTKHDLRGDAAERLIDELRRARARRAALAS